MKFLEYLNLRPGAEVAVGESGGTTLPIEPVSSAADILREGEGFVRTGLRRSPTNTAVLCEAMRLFDQAQKGNRRALTVLHEAMSTSDFPNIFGDIIDRQLLAYYQEAP